MTTQKDSITEQNGEDKMTKFETRMRLISLNDVTATQNGEDAIKLSGESYRTPATKNDTLKDVVNKNNGKKKNSTNDKRAGNISTTLNNEDTRTINMLLASGTKTRQSFYSKHVETQIHCDEIKDVKDTDTMDFHGKMIVECCHCLLQQMANTKASFPLHIIYNLSWKLIRVLDWCYAVTSRDRILHVVRAIDLHNRIARMLFMGIKEEITTDVSDRFCRCLYNMDSHPMANKGTVEHCMILLVFGQIVPTEDLMISLSHVHTEHQRRAALVCLSLMSHEAYEEFRLRKNKVNVDTYYKALQEDSEEEDTDDEEAEHKICITKKKDKPKFLQLQSPRLLQELCRLCIYQNMPKGKTPQCVQQLEIPKLLKRYLTLEVMPM